jgi:hypothetical protein
MTPCLSLRPHVSTPLTIEYVLIKTGVWQLNWNLLRNLILSHISLIIASRFEDLMSVSVRIMVIWGVTPCSLGNSYQIQMSQMPHLHVPLLT